jgi:hypothetical protein
MKPITDRFEPQKADPIDGAARPEAPRPRALAWLKGITSNFRLRPRERSGVEAVMTGEAEPSGKARTRFVSFDEQRYFGEQGRADIVFGPDMFDPRTENGARPLSAAVAEGNSDIDTRDFDKTVGEVLGADIALEDLARVSLANAHSIEVSSADTSDD